MSYHLFANGDFSYVLQSLGDQYVLQSLGDQFSGADMVVPYVSGYHRASLYEVLYYKRDINVARWNSSEKRTIMVLSKNQVGLLVELKQVAPQESRLPSGFDFK